MDNAWRGVVGCDLVLYICTFCVQVFFARFASKLVVRRVGASFREGSGAWVLPSCASLFLPWVDVFRSVLCPLCMSCRVSYNCVLLSRLWTVRSLAASKSCRGCWPVRRIVLLSCRRGTREYSDVLPTTGRDRRLDSVAVRGRSLEDV